MKNIDTKVLSSSAASSFNKYCSEPIHHLWWQNPCSWLRFCCHLHLSVECGACTLLGESSCRLSSDPAKTLGLQWKKNRKEKHWTNIMPKKGTQVGLEMLDWMIMVRKKPPRKMNEATISMNYCISWTDWTHAKDHVLARNSLGKQRWAIENALPGTPNPFAYSSQSLLK